MDSIHLFHTIKTTDMHLFVANTDTKSQSTLVSVNENTV